MLETIFAGLVGLDGPLRRTPSRFFSDFFPAALLALGIAGLRSLLSLLVFRAVVAAAPARPRTTASAPASSSAPTASDTLAYFALRDDKSYFFSADGERDDRLHAT